MTVLLAPGFMTDADLWSDMEEDMADLRPFFHVDPSRDGSIKAMARRALADAPPSFLTVGFSMGGYVAREIVRMAPERVCGLVLIATSARADTPEQVRRKVERAKQAKGLAFVGLSRAAVATSLHPDSAKNAALIARIQAMTARLGAEVFRRQCLLDRPGDLDRLDEIRCPTLILAGDKDPLRLPEEAEEMQAGIVGSDLMVIEGSGHMLPLEAPRRVAEVISAWIETRRVPA